jgi:adenylate cyclase
LGVLATADIFLFEEFRLDRGGDGLSRRDEHGVFVPISIGPRALDVLGVLVEHSGDLVSKEEIMAAVWRRTVVENANLTVQISALRRVLDHGRSDGSCIQTVAARGYRFTAAVTAAHSSRLPGGPARPPPRLSIVVLPFTNLGNDPEQQYFADGLVDDLTTDLSRIDDMFVISRNSAFTYKGRAVTAKQIGRELGVRYVLEGSVRRSSNQLRVNAQLIDAETGAHLWAERFDRDTGDPFALQNEITSRIAVALDIELVGAEASRPAERPDALDYILRGRAASWKSPTPEKYSEAIGFFERALALEPASVEAQSRLAAALSARVLYRNNTTAPAAADLARADKLAGQALATSPRSPIAHYAKGWSLHAQRRWEEAIPEYETVIAFNRNSVGAIANLGWCKFWTGSPEEAIALYEQAIRLSPRDPNISFWYFRIGLVRLLQSRAQEAIVWFNQACRAAPEYPFTHSCLASAYALTGDSSRACIELAEAKRLVSDHRYTSIARLKTISYLGPPKIRSLFETTFLAGLREAGLPEE